MRFSYDSNLGAVPFFICRRMRLKFDCRHLRWHRQHPWSSLQYIPTLPAWPCKKMGAGLFQIFYNVSYPCIRLPFSSQKKPSVKRFVNCHSHWQQHCHRFQYLLLFKKDGCKHNFLILSKFLPDYIVYVVSHTKFTLTSCSLRLLKKASWLSKQSKKEKLPRSPNCPFVKL